MLRLKFIFRVLGVFLPVNPTRLEPEPNASASGSYPLKGVDKKTLLAEIPKRADEMAFPNKDFGKL